MPSMKVPWAKVTITPEAVREMEAVRAELERLREERVKQGNRIMDLLTERERLREEARVQHEWALDYKEQRDYLLARLRRIEEAAKIALPFVSPGGFPDGLRAALEEA